MLALTPLEPHPTTRYHHPAPSSYAAARDKRGRRKETGEMTGKLAQAAEALAVMIAKAKPMPCDYSVIWINEDDAKGESLDVDGLISQGYARRIKAG